MKKTLLFLLTTMLVACGLSACRQEQGEVSTDDDKIQIVTTIFPEFDWVRSVLGDNPAQVELTMLLDTGVDLHSFQPTAEDILRISTCDLFIYVGGESDEWVEDALQQVVNKDMTVINLLDVLGDAVKEEEVVEGMQEEEHDHDHEETEKHNEEDHDHEEEVEYDEHVWLSLKNASILVSKICEAMERIDPAHMDAYKRNAAAYIEKLNALDTAYAAAVADAKTKTVLFGDRFPFRYLVDDYGLSYYAAFVGCSAETEASFETITFLSQKVDELGLHTVLTIEGPNHRIAETIVQNTQTKDQQILAMNSIQSVTARDVQNGVTYLAIMKNNLAVLSDALK